MPLGGGHWQGAGARQHALQKRGANLPARPTVFGCARTGQRFLGRKEEEKKTIVIVLLFAQTIESVFARVLWGGLWAARSAWKSNTQMCINESKSQRENGRLSRVQQLAMTLVGGHTTAFFFTCHILIKTAR